MAWEAFKYAETDTVLPAKILVIDEVQQFLESSSDRKAERLADRLRDNMQSIARLGRASHIHLIMSTQSPSGNSFPTALKNNVSQRVICGRVEENISNAIIDSSEGASIPLSPGSYLGFSKGETQQFQGFFIKKAEVLALGTVKEGYDPKTGQSLKNDDFDMSPIEEPKEEPEEQKLEPEEQEQPRSIQKEETEEEVVTEEEAEEFDDGSFSDIGDGEEFLNRAEKVQLRFNIKTNKKPAIKIKIQQKR